MSDRESDITCTECVCCGAEGSTAQSGGDIHDYHSADGRSIELCEKCVSFDEWAEVFTLPDAADSDVLTPELFGKLIEAVSEELHRCTSHQLVFVNGIAERVANELSRPPVTLRLTQDADEVGTCYEWSVWRDDEQRAGGYSRTVDDCLNDARSYLENALNSEVKP